MRGKHIPCYVRAFNDKRDKKANENMKSFTLTCIFEA